MEIIAVANKKGGVGKTTTALAFAAILAHEGNRVLLVDMDPQGNASAASGTEPDAAGTAELLKGENTVSELIQSTNGGYDFVSSDATLTQAVSDLPNVGRELLLRRALEGANYDFVIIDTPPAMGILTVSALVAADSIIAPCQADRFNLTGLMDLSRNVQAIGRAYKTEPKIKGLLFTRHKERTNATKAILPFFEKLADDMGSKIMKTKIREDVKIRESHLQAQDLLSYAPASRAYADYSEAVREYLDI